MDINSLKTELKNIEDLIAKLEGYEDKTLGTIAVDLQNQLKTIKTFPQITTTGLESVESILRQLQICKIAVKELIEEEKNPPVAQNDIVDKPENNTNPPIASSWTNSSETVNNNQNNSQDGPQPKSHFNNTSQTP